MRRTSAPTEPVHGVVGPAFCIIAQGSKEVVVGEERYRYDPYHYLLATVELPLVGQVMEGAKDKPYFAVRLYLDPVLVGVTLVVEVLGQRLNQPGLHLDLAQEGLQGFVIHRLEEKEPSKASALFPCRLASLRSHRLTLYAP